jgi:hypothetical protein
VLVSPFLFSLGCAGTHYYYAPTPPTTMNPVGIRGAMYPIPRGQEKSSVRILPIGIREADGHKALQIRYYFENYAGKTWYLDIMSQSVKFQGEGQMFNALPSTAGAVGGSIEIPAGFSHLVDIYFPIPKSISSDSDLEQLELNWSIKMGSGSVDEQTSFTRVSVSNESVENSSSTSKAGKKK